MDNKTRIEVLKEEERKILEERQEQLADEQAKRAAEKEELVEEIVDKYLEQSKKEGMIVKHLTYCIFCSCSCPWK